MRRLTNRHPGVLLMLCSLSFAHLSLGGCDRTSSEPSTREPETPPLEEKKELAPPPEYTGPLDPMWPPVRPEGQAVHLEASRLFRDQIAARKNKKQVSRASSSRPKNPELFVERGKIGEFEYLEVILGEIRNPDHPMPLIVVLHGRGGKPTIPSKDFKGDQPIRFFIPQGPDKLGGGYNWLAARTQGGETQLLTRSLSARVDQLAPAIRAFQKLHPTLGKPVVTGFSQGGILSFTLATRYPEQFAAAFPLAGWLPPALYPSAYPRRKFPYIYAQQPKDDKIVPAKLARDSVQALRARGLRVDYKETPGGHHVTPGMNRELHRATRKFLRGYLRRRPEK